MKIVKAILYMHEKHKGQVRKVSGLPYSSHPIIVSEILRKYKTSKNITDMVIAALLHDVVEDTTGTIEEIKSLFGNLPASLVEELTSDKEEIKKVGKNPYLINKMVHMTSYALVIKLCDRLSNIIDEPTDKYCKDTLVLLDNIENKRDSLSETHKAIMKEIRHNILCR